MKQTEKSEFSCPYGLDCSTLLNIYRSDAQCKWLADLSSCPHLPIFSLSCGKVRQPECLPSFFLSNSRLILRGRRTEQRWPALPQWTEQQPGRVGSASVHLEEYQFVPNSWLSFELKVPPLTIVVQLLKVKTIFMGRNYSLWGSSVLAKVFLIRPTPSFILCFINGWPKCFTQFFTSVEGFPCHGWELSVCIYLFLHLRVKRYHYFLHNRDKAIKTNKCLDQNRTSWEALSWGVTFHPKT